jgi:hypothetical protein
MLSVPENFATPFALARRGARLWGALSRIIPKNSDMRVYAELFANFRAPL